MNQDSDNLTITIPKYLGATPEDIEDVLFIIEKSYDILFEKDELGYVKTFGELCDHIISKIELQNAEDCTTQQAFYKLKNAIIELKQIDKTSIRTETILTFIFPRHNRQKMISIIEHNLGFKLNVFRPKYFISMSLFILVIVSVIEIYFNWRIGLSGFVISILLLRISLMTGKEFKVRTIGELADKMSQENYLKSRRNPKTVNKKEIVKKLGQLFINHLHLGNSINEIPPQTIIINRK